LSTDATAVDSGSLDYALASQLQKLPPGVYTLELTLRGDTVSRDLDLRDGGAANVVVTADVTGESDWQVSVINVPAPEAELDASARLYLVHAADGDARTYDVGIDNLAEPDGTIEPGSTSDAFPLDVTRPALAFLKDGVIEEDFTLPMPEAGSSVIAVLLGESPTDGAAERDFRLLVARMSAEAAVSEVRADPTVYFLHASGVHGGVDLFVGPGHPRATAVREAPSSPTIDTFAVSQASNEKLIRAEMVDNARFGELRVARAPAGPATLEAYLTVPSDAQLPAPLTYNLIGAPLPNQRLRNGAAIARQGTSAVGGSLEEGAEYLLILPAVGPWFDNRSKFVNDAPGLPFERLERSRPSADKASIRVAVSVTINGAPNPLPVRVALDDEVIVTGVRPFQLKPGRDVAPGIHQLSFDIEAQVTLPAPLQLQIEAQAGQDLIVVAAGDARPESVTTPAIPRADDVDADTTVSAPLDPETQRSLDPNYLPVDGDSTLIQDDCPDQPGPISHKGCPATGLHWLVLDLSTRPPTVRVLPMN
jgi:hypothetical protein